MQKLMKSDVVIPDGKSTAKSLMKNIGREYNGLEKINS